jgi:hypothetical protein
MLPEICFHLHDAFTSKKRGHNELLPFCIAGRHIYNQFRETKLPSLFDACVQTSGQIIFQETQKIKIISSFV